MRNIMEQANKYIKNIINTQRSFFYSNKTKDITFRKKMLCKLKKAIKHKINIKKVSRIKYWHKYLQYEIR